MIESIFYINRIPFHFTHQMVRNYLFIYMKHNCNNIFILCIEDCACCFTEKTLFTFIYNSHSSLKILLNFYRNLHLNHKMFPKRKNEVPLAMMGWKWDQKRANLLQIGILLLTCKINSFFIYYYYFTFLMLLLM